MIEALLVINGSRWMEESTKAFVSVIFTVLRRNATTTQSADLKLWICFV